jgi:hypothetical protein
MSGQSTASAAADGVSAPDARGRPGGVALARAPSARQLGRAIRGLRRTRGFTIEALAFAAGLHPTYLSGIERGERNPSWAKL